MDVGHRLPPGPSPGGRRRFAYIAQDITENRLAKETIAKHIRLADYGRDVARHSPKTPRWDGCYTAARRRWSATSTRRSPVSGCSRVRKTR